MVLSFFVCLGFLPVCFILFFPKLLQFSDSLGTKSILEKQFVTENADSLVT